MLTKKKPSPKKNNLVIKSGASMKISEEPAILPYQPHELVHKLAFSQDNVMAAAAEQPILFYHASEHHVACFRQYLTTKQELATVQAASKLAEREAGMASGEKAPPQWFVEAKAQLDTQVAEAQVAFQEADQNLEASKLLLEAYRMRRDSLRVMMEWRGADLRAQQAQEFGNAFIAEASANLEKRYPKG